MRLKTIAVVMTIILIFSMSIESNAAVANRKVDWLINEGLVTGYPDGTYGLENTITRAEVSAMVTRALNSEGVSEVLKPIQGRFRDVLTTHWANGYINYVASVGYVNGYPDNTFKPNNNITYAEVIKILVMVNGELPDTSGYEGALWATPYIVKAIETGIMNGIVISDGDYGAQATRGKVFEMIYNTLMISYLEGIEDYTAIVIGNTRTSRTDKNEVMLTVIESGEGSGNLKYNYEIGDNFTVKLDSTEDSEDLLGKVVRIELDNEGTFVKLTVDLNYDYYIGPFLAYEDSIMINTGEILEVYNGTRSSRYTDSLYGFYHNDKKYSYLDFVDQFDELDGNMDRSLVTEFSRITMRDGVVYFIDSYDFEDIAPVAGVEDSGRIISIYDDNSNSQIKKVSLKSIYGYYDGRFENVELEDVLAEDVIHIYGDRAILKMDSAYSGQYKGIDESTETYYALINRQYFQIRNTDYKKPVFSLDGVTFSVLNDYEAYDVLQSLEGSRVVFLIDLNESLQMISHYY